jgi:uncharacterized membrane protein YfcA
MLDLSVIEIVIGIFIVTLGAFTQGSIGFGFALVSAPLLMLVNVNYVPGPIITAALLTAGLISFRERRSAELGKIKWLVVGRIIGNLIGAAIIAYISVTKFTIMFGVLVILAVFLSASGLHVKVNIKNMISAGFLSGFMGTTVSIGGPPAALLFQHERGPRFRATMSNFFMIGVVFSILSLTIMGEFGLNELVLGISLMPGVIIGVYISRHMTKKLDQHAIRPYVLGLSGISGFLAIVKVLIF